MTPEISEFSYGFALTNEMVGWLPLQAAPIFPSLIAEGQAGGGYDVKLDSPGVPVFLQFKRSECMTRRSAKEIAKFGAPLDVPFHRFPITEAGKSNQHQMLCDLDDGKNFVAYVAPRFHRLSEIDQAWGGGQVVSRSVFVRPSAIGQPPAGSHTIAFDDVAAYMCSEPEEIPIIRGGEILSELEAALESEGRPVAEAVNGWLDQIRDAEARESLDPWPDEAADKSQIADTEETAAKFMPRTIEYVDAELLTGPSVRPIPTRSPREVSGPQSSLRQAADIALGVLHTQMIVVQKR